MVFNTHIYQNSHQQIQQSISFHLSFRTQNATLHAAESRAMSNMAIPSSLF